MFHCITLHYSPLAWRAQATLECQWVTGAVSRPLEQLMFSESPRRKSRTSRIIQELLDTPPDLSDAADAKPDPSRVTNTESTAKKASTKRVTGNSNPRVALRQLRPGSDQIDRPPLAQISQSVHRSALSSVGVHGVRAIWFVLSETDVGNTDINRLSSEEEATMNRALQSVRSSRLYDLWHMGPFPTSIVQHRTRIRTWPRRLSWIWKIVF